MDTTSTQKPKLPNQVVLEIAGATETHPQTVRRAYQGLQGKGASFRRVVAALKERGLLPLCALLLALGCAQEGIGAQPSPDTSPALSTAPQRGLGTLPAGTGGQTSQASTAVPGMGGQAGSTTSGSTWNSTGGQVGTGGASAATDAGGGRQDSGAPAGPEVGGDAASVVLGSDASITPDIGSNSDTAYATHPVPCITPYNEAQCWDALPDLSPGTPSCPVILTAAVGKNDAGVTACLFDVTVPAGMSTWLYEGGQFTTSWGFTGPSTGATQIMLMKSACGGVIVQLLFSCSSFTPPMVLP